MQTVAHVTHEAIHKVGGIGAVLHGLLTSATYLEKVNRNILIGPLWPGDEAADMRLGEDGEVLYSSVDSLNRSPLAAKFREIEQTFNVGIVYGRRKFVEKGTGVTSTPEVVLIDVSRFDAGKLGEFKFKLWEKFGLPSAKYEHIWDFDLWVRLALPALAALHAVGATSSVEPCVVLSHEYMGIATCLGAILEGELGNFRTIFYAHETATMRRIVEGRAGHDTMFYNVMRTALAEGRFVEDVFGDQSDFYKHGLLKTTRFFDEVFAVGDYVQQEFVFLGSDFVHLNSQIAYNGVPCWKISVEEKISSRNRLRKYCNNLLGFEPDYVMSHVTRLVPSKGLWRDLRVLAHLEPILRQRGESAVVFVLSTEVAGRRPDDILRMEAQYKWPVAHREGGADLSTGEAVYYQGVQEFNARSRNVKVVFINQFGFDQRACGSRMPREMEFMDIRKGSDAEFGQSIYEPFGIAQVEPISFGGICVFSNVCGCAGFVKRANGGKASPNVIVADYTDLPNKGLRAEQLLAIGKEERDSLEDTVAEMTARELMDRLPTTPAEMEAGIERGYALAREMSWDVVARDFVLPGIAKAVKAQRLLQIA